MRGVPGNANASLRWNTPDPSRRCAPIHLLPQGGEGKPALHPYPFRLRIVHWLQRCFRLEPFSGDLHLVG
ncbi:MAG: hypothetical protein EOQ30_10500 [Mesorhizobium sp.]|nr:MAG: hypothetical protein EOQ29_03760 [Mesorhizobium sp.]RWA84700.1 MAG: hypothetical protein EOQ30_10500 [Mesorhizobium sp.]RWB21768.1 MAG: hypothetical protein EOQ40_09620 [Mesorhizobium sp.]TIS51970.1 MAG: hypothetical protein E5W96_01380 [Mesorhizobium sp.]